MRRHPAAEYAEAILVAVLLALFTKAFVFEAFAIPSGSMQPALVPGDHVLVDKFVHAPHSGPWAALLPYRDVARGEVLVFRGPEDPALDLIKRVAGLPGETFAPEDRSSPLTLGTASYFMMGDNRDDSRDSRFWGPLPAPLVKGRAILVYWSYEPGRGFAGRGAALRKLVDTAIHFFGRTRWGRTFHLVR